jgi:hypothetical protein
MASAIKNATRLLKSYLKDIEGGTPSSEALKVRDALNHIDKSAYLLLETSYMDDLEVDAEQLENRWGDMDTLARYGFAA